MVFVVGDERRYLGVGAGWVFVGDVWERVIRFALVLGKGGLGRLVCG